MKVILGSKSPRRQELLNSLGFDIEIRTKEIDEIYPSDLNPLKVAEYLATLKGSHLKTELKENELLITSDTVVITNGILLGKPLNRLDAIEMITSLSGKSHQVITGVYLSTLTKEMQFSNTTEVFFDELTSEEIEFYVDQYKPFDKAGAYGIQEWIGYIGIRKIVGCYYNVMGLPLNELYQIVKGEFPEFISLRSR